MYRLYKTECEGNNVDKTHIAKEWLYADIFNKEFNLSFKIPDNDTYDACDSFLIKLREAHNTFEKEALQHEYDDHLQETSRRYNLKKEDKQKTIKEKRKKIMICIDLQKCLPTLVLANPVDACHSLIEGKKKRTAGFMIMTSWDWQQIGRICCISNPFQIINMETKKTDDFGNNFGISEIVHLKEEAENYGALYYKTSFDQKDITSINLIRSGRRDTFPEEIPNLRSGANAISTRK
ncbi:hypothetical protein ILUMI_25079 [Ignelater luminosus]|uniref:Uncharacterized protein n=1 Tax=Ignelater luminosus TaxID=2038154 RepID=A0A8K0FY67_IGNLU|nr:hypothetical protein ILUMI_25079 [Ignelater luminosus]